MARSAPPVASRLPSGLKATVNTASLVPAQIRDQIARGGAKQLHLAELGRRPRADGDQLAVRAVLNANRPVRRRS